MTDAHCHVSCGDASVREFLIGRDFIGVHPWDSDCWSSKVREDLRTRLVAKPRLGVGEIGLDRLRDRTISSAMRTCFEEQLHLAFELARPVVLHGAKCWGQIVTAIRAEIARTSIQTVPAFIFHGFSRSDGLIPDIIALGGFISVGPAVLNDHAVNYRELAKKIPSDHLLVETDRTETSDPVGIGDILNALAALRGVSFAELEAQTDANAEQARSNGKASD